MVDTCSGRALAAPSLLVLDVHPSEDGDGVDVEYRSVVGGRLGMVGLCFATLLFA